MLRWLLLLLAVPHAMAQAPTLDADVSTGQFSIDGATAFFVNGTLTCQAFDPDPDVVYTLAFGARHYTSDGANGTGIQIITPANLTYASPCMQIGAASRSFAARFVVVDLNATPEAMYHMDVTIDAFVAGRFGQAAPDATRVHTMGSAPARPVPAPTAEVPDKDASMGSVALIAMALLAAAYRR